MLQFNWTQIPAIIMLCVSQLMNLFGLGSICTNMLPDQMIGATADEIGAAVQWNFWTFAIGLLTRYLVCLPIPQLQKNLAVLYITLNFFSLSIFLITDCLFHTSLDNSFRSSNPLKTIFQVLNYARETKYPERHSGLTYFDEEEPSRLDYGKHKFGGPFTEEEVEDVKTVLRLLPVFLDLSLFGAYTANNLLKQNNPFQVHLIPTTAQNFKCIAGLQEMIFYSVAVLLIPVYQFIVFPLLHKHIPCLMKRGGAGVVLCLIGFTLDLTLDTVGHTYEQ